MTISLKRTTTVKPMEETPSGGLWVSNLDLLQPDAPYHTRFVLFYTYSGAANFFDATALTAALSRALVEFYPYAGRLRKDDSGRLEINCNGEGALFVEADCDCSVADLGGFSPNSDINLVPTVDYTNGISTFPLALLQLTRFKCGGICLGFAMEHHVADGTSLFEFVLRWCEISRGGAARATAPPILDRRLLAARDPPRPQFSHIEHHPAPAFITPLRHSGTTSSRTFSLNRNQINSLKRNCKTNNTDSNYSTYEVVAGHVWRCACIARQLPENQQTKLQFPTDGRRRLRPPLPAGYFGNVNFYTATVALCGELKSNPLRFAAGKVREAIARMDDEYLRSAVDYWELRLRSHVNGTPIPLVGNKMKCPNLSITNWIRMPCYEAEFGWGKPIYAGPGAATTEGKSYLFADPDNEGGLLLDITLHQQHMENFDKLLYDNTTLISKI